MSDLFDWTEAALARLRELWVAEPHVSTAAIGLDLGCSKNAVVGKAHRLQLLARPSPIRRGQPPKTPPHRSNPIALPRLASVAGPVHRPALMAIPAEALRIARVVVAPPRPARREGEGCRYIIGASQRHAVRQCDAARQPGSSYCPEHHAICHVAVHAAGDIPWRFGW